jgi:hypothetical protein
VSRITVIGLHGARSSGKDAVAHHLVERWGFEQIAYADPIRAGLLAIASATGLDETHFDDRIAKELPAAALNGRSPRVAMQTLGDWGIAHMGTDFWAWIASSRIRELVAQGVDRVVVSDVRKPIEVQTLTRDWHAQLWLVQRPGARFRHDHNSEWELPTDVINRGVLNDGTLADLHARVDTLIEETLPS